MQLSFCSEEVSLRIQRARQVAPCFISRIEFVDGVQCFVRCAFPPCVFSLTEFAASFLFCQVCIGSLFHLAH